MLIFQTFIIVMILWYCQNWSRLGQSLQTWIILLDMEQMHREEWTTPSWSIVFKMWSLWTNNKLEHIFGCVKVYHCDNIVKNCSRLDWNTQILSTSFHFSNSLFNGKLLDLTVSSPSRFFSLNESLPHIMRNSPQPASPSEWMSIKRAKY